MRLYTSRYGNQDEIIASELIPVGVTLGRPKFKLRYNLAANIISIAPRGLFHVSERTQFEHLYRTLLEQTGLDTIQYELESVSKAHGNKDLVLLCFEIVADGRDWCHRQIFAQWWEEKTGQHVRELRDAKCESDKENKQILSLF